LFPHYVLAPSCHLTLSPAIFVQLPKVNAQLGLPPPNNKIFANTVGDDLNNRRRSEWDSAAVLPVEPRGQRGAVSSELLKSPARDEGDGADDQLVECPNGVQSWEWMEGSRSSLPRKKLGGVGMVQRIRRRKITEVSSDIEYNQTVGEREGTSSDRIQAEVPFNWRIRRMSSDVRRDVIAGESPSTESSVTTGHSPDIQLVRDRRKRKRALVSRKAYGSSGIGVELEGQEDGGGGRVLSDRITKGSYDLYNNRNDLRGSCHTDLCTENTDSFGKNSRRDDICGGEHQTMEGEGARVDDSDSSTCLNPVDDASASPTSLPSRDALVADNPLLTVRASVPVCPAGPSSPSSRICVEPSGLFQIQNEQDNYSSQLSDITALSTSPPHNSHPTVTAASSQPYPSTAPILSPPDILPSAVQSHTGLTRTPSSPDLDNSQQRQSHSPYSSTQSTVRPLAMDFLCD